MPSQPQTPDLICKHIDDAILQTNPLLSALKTTPQPLRIKRATSNDVDDIMALVSGLAEYVEEDPLKVIKMTTKDFINDGFKENPVFHSLLLETAAGERVGLASFYFAYSTWDGRILYLEDLFIKLKYRSSGAGRVLLKTLACVGVNCKAGRFQWQTENTNLGAIKFYKGIGAGATEEWLTLRMDRIEMAKFLGEGGDTHKLDPVVSGMTPDVINQHIDETLITLNPLIQSTGMRIKRSTSTSVNDIMEQVIGLAVYEREEVERINMTADDYAIDGFQPNPLFYNLQLETSEGKTCGIALFFIGYSTWEGRMLYLEDLYVDPAYRGSGAGKAIMKTLAGVALRCGCGRFQWQALHWNEPALGFYKKIGAKVKVGLVNVRMDEEEMRGLAEKVGV